MKIITVNTCLLCPYLNHKWMCGTKSTPEEQAKGIVPDDCPLEDG